VPVQLVDRHSPGHCQTLGHLSLPILLVVKFVTTRVYRTFFSSHNSELFNLLTCIVSGAFMSNYIENNNELLLLLDLYNVGYTLLA